MNREKLQDEFIHATIEGMSLDDMYTALYDLLDDQISKCTDDELMEDVQEYYPELLDSFLL